MKRIVNILAILIAIFALLTTMVACDDEQNNEPVYTDYSVTVVDGLGNPIDSVMVKFLCPSGETKTKITDENGVASLKNVAADTYKITLEKGFSTAVITQTEYELTAEKTSLKLVLRNEKNTSDISGEIGEGSYAYRLNLGTNPITVSGEGISYFVFTPTNSGIYNVTLSSEAEGLVYAYYGMDFDVKATPVLTEDKSGEGIDVVIKDSSFSYVIGVSGASADAQISISRTGDAPIDIYGSVPEGTDALVIGSGSHSISVEAGEMKYFIFYANTEGVYSFNVTSDKDVTLGYYGGPMFVQPEHVGNGDYDGNSFDIIIRDIATPYVLGVYSNSDADVVLNIKRTADAPFDPIYAPWTEIQSTATLEKCDTTGKTLVDFDIASKDVSVTLGDDGYYYTNDGKLVYVRITSVTGHGRTEDFQFIPALSGSLALLAGHEDSNVGTNFGGYVYDENGNFVNKYRYNEMVKTYMEYTDSTYGVVPLTEEFAEAIKLHGEFNGWWDSDSYGYLFDGMIVYPDNLWLFLCMVEE